MKNFLWGLFVFASLAHAQGTVTDIDGNTYDYLTYGTQQWTVENAAMETYRDGTPIPQVTDATQWRNLTTGAWCYYDNDPSKGKLYNWYAVAGIHDNDPNTPNKEFAPEGWHVPTDAEWTTLEEHLIANGYNYDGSTTGNKIAKALASNSSWNSSTVIGTPGNTISSNNNSLFNSKPLGWRHGLYGGFSDINKNCNFWTSSISGIQNPDNTNEYYSWVRSLKNNEIHLLNYENENKDGFSVRFIKDSNTCSEASINASSNNICTGESVDLSVDGLNSSSGVNTQSHSFTTGNYTRIPYSSHLYNLPQSTIEFWYYQESSSEEFIVATEYFNTGWGFHVENNGGSPRFLEWRVSNGAARLGFDIPDRYEIPFNQWIHVAGVHDGSTVYLFVDGNLIDSAPYTGQIGDSYEDIVINRHTWASGSSERLNGKIDELRISNIARYTSNFTPPVYEFNNDSNTLALWHFNGNMQDESQYNTQSVTNGTNFSSNVPFGSYNFNSTDLLWSTGDTSETITVTPTETTEYWVDVTTNSVTCREYVTINVTAPAAPTGDAEQTFCDAATVADLTATGDNIQWYDAATGGNLLDSITAITDGQMVYASQTVNGCESTDRLEVSVSIQDITITASATEVCAGEGVDLNVNIIGSNFSNWNTNEPNNSGGNENFGMLVLVDNVKYNDHRDSNSNPDFLMESDSDLGFLSGFNFLGEFEGHFYYQSTSNYTWTNADATATSLGAYLLIINSQAEIDFIDQTSNITGHGSWIGMYQDTNHPDYSEPSGAWFWGDGTAVTMSSNPPTYTWSTGDTTETISVTPTETTEYWVDVTTNGVTCREYVTINVTAPLAPTGDSEQTFCTSSTVADLTATGDNIQWYEAATGGSLLDSTTALTDGQMVYASQTVNGCESTDRLEVSVSIQDITITASATEVCAGESSTLNVALTNSSGTFAEGQLVNEFNHTINTNASQQFPTTVGLNYRLEIEGNVTWGTYCPALAYDPAYVLSGFYGTTEATPRDFACNDAMYSSIFCDSPGLRPIPDQYDGINHSYDYYFTANSSQISVGFFDNLLGDNCGSVTFRLFENSTPPSQNSLVWSTGDTTETISVTPTETTEYWVDVTTNGVTCREYITIDVSAPAAPTGDAQQTFCTSSTVADLTATGENIQWYDAAIGGNLLDSITALTDGQIVYATQTVNGCESTDRLEVTVSIQDITITASATEVCAGESVDLTVSSGLTAGTTACTSTDLPANLQTGLVGYWPFCGNANDESGNGNNGTVNGATLTTDRFGNPDSAYNFDSVDDYLTIDSNNNQLDLYGNCCITISGWINIEDTNNQYGIFTNSGYNVNHQQYALKVDANDKLYFLSGNGLFEANGINYSTSSVEPNQWTHTAVTYDGSTLKLYLNGNLEFENQIVDYFPESPSETVFIGNSWGANNELFPGDIDDLAIWNRALSASEIQQLVNSFNHTSSFNDYEFFGEFQGSAYYVSTNPVDFSTASNFNSDNGVSFLTITSEQENNFLASGSLPGFLWLGCSDLNSEGDWNWLNGESFNYSNWDSGEPNNQVGGEDYAEFRTTGFWNDIPLFALNGDEVLRYHMFETTQFSSIVWSTGETTANISVSPTETTEYWVDVTTNGVTCREYVTINVTAPAAPTGDAEQTFCTAATVTDLTATGENIQWYDAAIGGNLLDPTTALTDGQTVYASQTVNGCESTDRLEVSVSIQDITITASATEVCAGESVDLSVIATVSATNIVYENNFDNGPGAEWTNGITSNFSSHPEYGEIFGPFGPGVQTQFNLLGVDNGEFNVSFDLLIMNSWDGDSSPQHPNGPDILYFNANGVNVFNSTFSHISTALGNPYSQTQSFPDNYGDGSYPAVNSGNLISGYTSEPSWFIDYSCNNVGTTPISSYQISEDLVVNNQNINIELFRNLDIETNSLCSENWALDNLVITQLNSAGYLWSTGDTTETISVTPTETTEYWVDVTTNGVTCREYVTITVNDLPEAPTGETVNYFINCDSFSPTLNDAIATLTGDNIKLYDAAVGGNLLDPNSNIIDGQVVYASQTLDSCESSDRLEVQLNLYTLDTPVTDAPNNTVSFCNEQNLTILDLAPAQTATDRLWYETATSTIPIPETTPLVDGVTYYVSNYDIETGCESDRLAMTVEINNPEAPTGDAVQSFCDNVTVSDLSASGSNIQWYDASTGGNVLDPGSALSDGQLLYASQTENGCESITRLEVSVEIDIIPDPILITTELEFCLAREATLADLEVDEQGFALEWYDSFSGGNMLSMDTLLEDGVSYYATLYDVASGCESLMRLEVVPTVIPCEVVIYNAISLNDNGMNDYMVIENAEYFPDNSLEIYNRDGHLLYSQTQYGIGDNFFRGIANVSGIYGSTLSGDGPRLPTGSYLYVFKYFNPYEQQEYTLKGFLTINSN